MREKVKGKGGGRGGGDNRKNGKEDRFGCGSTE